MPIWRPNSTDAIKKFYTDYKAAYGTDPENAFAALGYDTVGLIADAIKRAGSEDPAKIRDALAATKDYPRHHRLDHLSGRQPRAAEDGDDDRRQGSEADACRGGDAKLHSGAVTVAERRDGGTRAAVSDRSKV